MKKHICLAVILTLIFSSHLKAQSQYPAGSVFGPSGPTKVVDVTNPKTGRTWMDRNLGATRAAISATDAASYGDLYQWGRGADGHQLRTSATTTTLSSTDKPAHANFITVSLEYSGYFDWHSPQKDNFWQGLNGVNNPCPDGYRLPTDVEWEAELAADVEWEAEAFGEFASSLKLPLAGRRFNSGGSLYNVGSYGHYWSSTVSSALARYHYFGSSNAGMYSLSRAEGLSVRCLKD